MKQHQGRTYRTLYNMYARKITLTFLVCLRPTADAADPTIALEHALDIEEGTWTQSITR
jgi:hypothetical protein